LTARYQKQQLLRHKICHRRNFRNNPQSTRHQTACLSSISLIVRKFWTFDYFWLWE